MYIFFTFHYVLPLFINSNFLTELTSENTTSLIYAAAAVIAILAITTAAKSLMQLGDYQVTLWLVIAEIIAVILLAMPIPLWATLAAFLTHWVLTSVIRFNFDVFLEHYSDDATTGATRGAYLMVSHIAFVLAPLLAGFVLGDDIFWRVYALSAVFGLPVLYMLINHFRHFPDPEYNYTTAWNSLKHVWQNINVRYVLTSIFVLKLFYAWMVVYTPIYLHQYVGLPFDSIGIILSLMLLPFVLFAEPLGYIADNYLGEKELLFVGFLVAAGFTAALTFVESQSVLVWGGLLFGTRLGATAIDVMGNSYLFKQIEARNVGTISILRMIKPVAYIIGPLLAGAFLFFIPFQYIFVAIAGVLALGSLTALPLVDTR